ncbi:fatty acid desaturase family protein [Streptomyces halobius]|uniref:Acyl-CoA desaturase n=1 Tax=Streptomyces halobius TaxID=2879846 RepID=A0ABY4M3G0_9ACTN|nr:acyl-CoA desaturase [Streptomyces halobius]UQA91987.1 acyl-CoA desaturase [Streptomyces halobius]
MAAELDNVYSRTIGTLDENDVRYLRSIVRAQRALEAAGRCTIQFGRSRPARVAGVLALAAAKILDNLEIGHNVLHGQYDWAKDPHLHSDSYEWDTILPARLWRYQHNFVHHVYANIYGLDENLRAGPIRLSVQQPWQPHHIAGPLLLLATAPIAELAIALHAADEIGRGSTSSDLKSTPKRLRQDILLKAARQAAKDLVLFPLLSGRRAGDTLIANSSALVLRNLWIFAISLCNHYPEDVTVFNQDVLENETRGQRYVRQIRGAANIEGSRMLHILAGHFTHHIEHHLFPDVPSSRYREISYQVRNICERYGIPYTTASFPAQIASAFRNLCALALPPNGRKSFARRSRRHESGDWR